MENRMKIRMKKAGHVDGLMRAPGESFDVNNRTGQILIEREYAELIEVSSDPGDRKPEATALLAMDKRALLQFAADKDIEIPDAGATRAELAGYLVFKVLEEDGENPADGELDLADMSKKELLELAKNAGIDLPDKRLRQAEIVGYLSMKLAEAKENKSEEGSQTEETGGSPQGEGSGNGTAADAGEGS